MALTSGHYIGHEYDRMIVLFSMRDDGKEIPCAISTSAMDYRLRDRIEARGQQVSSDGT